MSDPDGINIEQYLGVWAMHQLHMLELANHVRTMDLAAHVTTIRAGRANDSDPDRIGQYEILDGGIAMIDVVGTMTKYGSSLSQMQYGTVGVRQAIRKALRNDQVKTILLRVDSPGGNFSGTSDLADDVFAARQKKPVMAYIEDLGASAAYFVASQASRVVANPTAFVGSIGTYGVVADYSGLAAKEGIKVHVIRAGEFKGMGEPGTEVTHDQLLEMQRTVDQANSFFVSAVARGRGMSGDDVIELADGRLHVAASAVKLKLIDAVQTLDQAIDSLRNTGTGRSSRSLTKGQKQMSEQHDPATSAAQAVPAPATLSELKSTFPASNADWRERCLEQGFTLSQATQAWIKELEARAAETNKKLADQEAKVAEMEKQAKTRSLGQEPLTTGATSVNDGGDVKTQVKALVDEKIRDTGKPRHDCYAMVMRENPELREALVASANSNRGK